MYFISVLIAVLLIGSAVAIVHLVESTLADRRLRRGWQATAAFLVIAAFIELYLCIVNPVSMSSLVAMFIPLVLSVAVLVYFILLKKTINYLTEINTISGIIVRDPVSGVFNRAYLEQRLDTEVARCHRYGSPLAVVAVEIVDFLLLNDEYGHQGSAIATSKLAKRLTVLLRETDVVANFSAGQFVLVLPDTPEGNLDGLVDRLRGAINEMVIIDGGGVEPSVKLNVTFGTSHCELSTRDGRELIDKAFYSISGESPFDYVTEPDFIQTGATAAVNGAFYNVSNQCGENVA